MKIELLYSCIIKLPLLSIIFLFFFVLKIVNAQEQTPDKIFKQKNYAEYLLNLSDELKGIYAAKYSLETVTRVAVAIDKTNGWDGEADKQARELMKDAVDALRYYDGVKMLLKQDTGGLNKLTEGTMPASDIFMRIYNIFKDHGYELAANAAGVLTPDMPGKRILYLAGIPVDKRGPVEKALMMKIKDPINRRMYAETALEMYLHPPKNINEINPKEFMAVALQVGKGTNIVSFDTADKLCMEGKYDEAIQMARIVAEEKPANESIQMEAARIIKMCKNNDAVISFYMNAMKQMAEPQRRQIRLSYLDYLVFNKKNEEITELQSDSDALMAGDAFLMNNKFDEATKKYASVAVNLKEPVERRISSWAGLFDSAPDKAFKNCHYFPGEIAKSDKKIRPGLTAWTAKRLWVVVNRGLPGMKYGVDRCKPLKDIADWQKQAAIIADNLLKIDETACMRGDNLYGTDSFRYGAAMIYSLAGEPKKAADIISKKIEYQVDPPEGGWKIFDGTLMPDFDKPRKFTSPSGIDENKMVAQLFMNLSKCEKAAEIVPPLAAIIADRTAKKLAVLNDKKEILAQMNYIVLALKYTVTSLDPLPVPLRTNMPPPPIRDVDMAIYTPIDTAVRKSLQNNIAATEGHLYLKECLLPSLMTAANPDLLNALTDLTSYTIKRYAETSNNQHDADSTKASLIEILANRKVYNMKPYIERLKNGEK